MTSWLRVTCANRAVVMLIQNIFHVCPLAKCICRQHDQSWSCGCLPTQSVTHACTSCRSLVRTRAYTGRGRSWVSLQTQPLATWSCRVAVPAVCSPALPALPADLGFYQTSPFSQSSACSRGKLWKVRKGQILYAKPCLEPGVSSESL